jgi:hypothetical protein
VKVTSGGFVQTEERRSGGSYLSQNDTRLHFGLEKRGRVDTVQVRWPSGGTQVFADLPVNAFVRLTEGDPTPRLVLQK